MFYGVQQNLPAALPAVPWLLGCSALRARDALRPAKRELGFAGLGQALRAQLVTQNGFTNQINDTGVTKRQVNSTLSEIIAPLLSARLHARAITTIRINM